MQANKLTFLKLETQVAHHGGQDILDFGLIRSRIKYSLLEAAEMKPERASAETKKALSHNCHMGSSTPRTAILSPHDVKAIKRAIKEVSDFVQNQQKRGDPRLPVIEEAIN